MNNFDRLPFSLECQQLTSHTNFVIDENKRTFLFSDMECSDMTANIKINVLIQCELICSINTRKHLFEHFHFFLLYYTYQVNVLIQSEVTEVLIQLIECLKYFRSKLILECIVSLPLFSLIWLWWSVSHW